MKIIIIECFEAYKDVEAALGEFEKVRKPVVEEYQDAAYASLLLFENAKEELHLDPIPFAYRLMTRSNRITDEKLRKRDPQFMAAYDRWREQRGSGVQNLE